MAEDISRRVENLNRELTKQCLRYKHLARANYWSFLFLTGLAIATSFLAGVLGLGFGVDTRIVAVIALIPSGAVSIATHFQLQGKKDLHYWKLAGVRSLWRRINYELSDPTATDIAAISKELSKIEAAIIAAADTSRSSVAAGAGT